jgi:tetratricopeptide (TPR) repeat protein
MKVRQIFVVFFIVSCFYGFSQDLNSEIGFKYVKADYLIKTQRNDEAIKELNDIINENPSFNNVLFLRADLKFKSGDYPGARADALKAIELKGITAESAAILGRSEFALNNKPVAELTLEAAIKLGINEEKVLLDYASILLDKKSVDKACLVWQSAVRTGSSTAAINISKYCGTNGNGSIPANSETIGNQVAESGTNTTTPKTESQNAQVTIQENSEQQTSISSDSLSGGLNDFSFPVPEEDNTINDVVIDEDLTISLFGQGLGKRRILEKPSILILSEKDGEVAIEICVNENGRVDTAEFIAGKSTIDNKGLVSLAVRKSKDFWFEKSDFRKQCGFIIYKVKGS